MSAVEASPPPIRSTTRAAVSSQAPTPPSSTGSVRLPSPAAHSAATFLAGKPASRSTSAARVARSAETARAVATTVSVPPARSRASGETTAAVMRPFHTIGRLRCEVRTSYHALDNQEQAKCHECHTCQPLRSLPHPLPDQRTEREPQLTRHDGLNPDRDKNRDQGQAAQPEAGIRSRARRG
jgi:hypothetical protein